MTLQPPSFPEPIRSGDLAFTMRDPHDHREPPKFTIIYQTKAEPTQAQFGAFPSAVPHEVHDLLMAGGRRPYTHQAEASRQFLEEGANVALITPTASGKTVSFLAPALSTLFQDSGSTALMIYPMNALATDQLKVLSTVGFKKAKKGLYELPLGNTVIKAEVQNADTPEGLRPKIRRDANLLITNHVALHHALLAQTNRAYKDGSSWNRFLSSLKVLVLDEGHSYNGVQGTNAALAFRRLSSLVYKLSGAYPKVLMASATIGNPLEHAHNLTGLDDWALVDQSGAASQSREIFIALPGLHPKGRGPWAASTVAMDIAKAEVEHGRRVLIFCSSRNGTEKLADRLNDLMGHQVAVPFHAALPAEAKRAFLEDILKGKTQVVCSTSALELGVDIGGMDTVILVGHPGDHASFNQRIGRVGRTSPGRVFLVLDEGQHPMNNYLIGNPEAIFWAPECRTIYPLNRIIATRHAACSYLETKDADLVHKAFPSVDDDEVQQAMADNPYGRIAMVGLGNFGQFQALDPEGQVIQELGGETALLHWHLRATIRNPIGQFFRVERIDLKGQKVFTSKMGEKFRIHTSPTIATSHHAKQDTLINLTDLPLADLVDPVAGEFDVQRVTVGYMESTEGDPKEGRSQSQALALEPEEMNPPIGILTRGVRFGLKLDHPLAVSILKTEGGVEATQDALGWTVALLVQARAEDAPVEIAVDGELLIFFIFDMAEGGMGWAEQLAPRLDRWFAAAGKALLNCSCQMKGCPRCSLSLTRGLQREALAEALIAMGRR